MEHNEIREYAGLSDRVRKMLQGEEGLDIEFKQSITGLEVSDIVAFANSPRGGTILIGIREEIKDDGRQVGKIHGCRVGDKEKLKIVGRINNIIPQLDCDIIVENKEVKPFYRIEIPSGPDKPYCTSSGEYKLRDDGYSKPMFPDVLLDLLLERESDKFFNRFSQATKILDDHISSISKRVKKELDEVEDYMKKLGEKTDVIMGELGIETQEKK